MAGSEQHSLEHSLSGLCESRHVPVTQMTQRDARQVDLGV